MRPDFDEWLANLRADFDAALARLLAILDRVETAEPGDRRKG
jgi:putative component of toxin-antitoxin plasmid stabilization module